MQRSAPSQADFSFLALSEQPDTSLQAGIRPCDNVPPEKCTGCVDDSYAVMLTTFQNI